MPTREEIESGKYVWYIDHWKPAEAMFPTRRESGHELLDIPSLHRMLDRRSMVNSLMRLRQNNFKPVIVQEEQR